LRQLLGFLEAGWQRDFYLARRLDRAVRAEIAAMDREAEEPLLALVRAP